jgi:sporulation protein YlmC with PRC-barrel domain
MIKLSSLYGMKVFGSEGGNMGNIMDIILNLEDGSVVRLLLKSMNKIKADELTSFIRKNSILYKRVVSAKDIMIVSTE